MASAASDPTIITDVIQLTRREFLTRAGATSAGLLAAGSLLPRAFAAQAASTQPSRPNIVLLLADDLGYADLGVQGCRDIATPRIDSIAKRGVRFTSGYVTCPICAPTRAGLLTGRYQQRFGFEHNPGPEHEASEDFGLPREELTLAERLKRAGYATGMFGKWHVGYREGLRPTERGFDEFFGFLTGAHDYDPTISRRTNPLLRGTIPVTEKEYLTDAFAREAMAFIDRHNDQPFFLYLPFNAVHSPLQASAKVRDRVKDIKDETRRTYATMLTAMDDAVGGVLGKLREYRLDDRTLIFFLSDNGGPTWQTTSRNDPLRGYKGQVYEGGIRIPFLMQWHGHVPADRTYDYPVVSLDIHATALAAAGIPVRPAMQLDGIDLVPFLHGKKDTPHDALFWRFGRQSAVRAGDWKVVARRRSAPQLFNLSRDVGEETDLAAQEPERLRELQAAYKKWNAGNIPAKWRRSERDSRGGE
ncbi:MAG TPA: sulfatase [Phycisphaerae bacterium]|nr:sulfatase [Phycisphaerae bacterium]HNU44795.1 sulfatase [Phycisphaerae bacterium]